jgi:hypothetical protein
VQRALFQEDGRADAGAIFRGETLDMQDQAVFFANFGVGCEFSRRHVDRPE